MTVSSLGDLARSYTLRNQTTLLKADLERRSVEATTGRTTDAGRTLRGDFTPLTAIDAKLAQLETYKSATSEATLTASTMQTALDTLSDIAGALSTSLLAAASPGNPTAINAVGRDAQVRFSSAMATLNTRVGDRTLFAGTSTTSAAVTNADEILDTLESISIGAASAADVEAAISAWFADPAGFTTLGYQGGAPLDPLQIAPGEIVTLDATANDPAIRNTLKSLAIAALLDRGILSSDTAQRAALAQRAGEGLLESASGRTELAARIGTAEERIATAEIRNAAEATSLGIARSGIVSIDAYAAATALTDAETQLDTLYAITARLARLSLSNYL
jgi:flagellar hook-associated protein 3 FlgL